jgi:hypothetical protein
MRLKFLLNGLAFSSFTMYFSCSLIVVQAANKHHILHSHNWKYESLKILIPHIRHALFMLSYICVKHRKETFAKFWIYNPKLIRSCSRFFIRKSHQIVFVFSPPFYVKFEGWNVSLTSCNNRSCKVLHSCTAAIYRSEIYVSMKSNNEKFLNL